jgi:hypothetical protein
MARATGNLFPKLQTAPIENVVVVPFGGTEEDISSEDLEGDPPELQHAKFAIEKFMAGVDAATVDTAMDRVDQDATAFGKWMGTVLTATPDQQLDHLCDLVMQGAPKTLNVVEKMNLKAGLKQVFKTSLEDLAKGKASVLDKVFFAKLEQELNEAIEKAPITATAWQRMKRGGVAALVGGLFGFGLVALTMKCIVHFSGLGLGGVHFTALAGPWIAFVVEYAIGAIKSGGAGYGAGDPAATQEYHFIMAKMAALQQKLQGLKNNPNPDQEAINEVERKIDNLWLKVQPIAVDLLRREFGHSLGLKTQDQLGDVPRGCLKTINSKLQAQDGRLMLANGELVFTVISAPVTGGEVIVEWPSKDPLTWQPRRTNLLRDPIPPEHKAAFEQVVSAAIDSATERARISDATFMIFGIPFLWNMAGPYMVINKLTGAEVGDTLLMFASSFIGTFMLVAFQDVVNKHFQGMPTAWGTHTTVAEKKAALLQAKMSHAELRRTVYQQARAQLNQDIRHARALLAEVKGKFEGNEATQQEVDAADARLQVLLTRNTRLKQACKALVLERKALKTDFRKTAGGMHMTVAGLNENWRKLWTEKTRIPTRFFGYVLCYVLYAEVWTLTFQASLMPRLPVPDNSTIGNLTEPVANATAAVAQSVPWEQVRGAAAMNGFGGLFMATVFWGRFNPFGKAYNYGSRMAGGLFDRLVARFADNNAAVRAYSGRLAQVWRNQGLSQEHADKILTVLVGVDADVLVQGGEAMERDLGELAKNPGDDTVWDRAEVVMLAEAIDQVVTQWEKWEESFADHLGDMKTALLNVRGWCAKWLSLDGEVDDDSRAAVIDDLVPTGDAGRDYVLADAWATGVSTLDPGLPGRSQIEALLRRVPPELMGKSTGDARMTEIAKRLGWTGETYVNMINAINSVLLDEDSYENYWQDHTPAVRVALRAIRDWATQQQPDDESSSSDRD